MVEPGFVKGASDNLPKIDSISLFHFLGSNPDFIGAEIRGSKLERSGRESYGDVAVGKVQVKRNGSLCIVRARVTPEHKVRNKPYKVEVICDEVKNEVQSITCEGCAAALGGCKHAIALLTWIHRRSEEPSVTSTTCYWKKATLSRVGRDIKFIKATDLRKPPKTATTTEDNKKMFVKLVKEESSKNCNFQTNVTKYWNNKTDVQKLSVHIMAEEFFRKKIGNSAKDLLKFMTENTSEEVCQKAFYATNGQSQNILWNELRYGRVTASKIHEVSRCNTFDGVLVESIFGAKISTDSTAMARGRDLEPLVIIELQKLTNMKFKTCGIMIDAKNPIIGASADAINEKYVVEIKCPSKEKTVTNYIMDRKIKDRYHAQLQLQMYVHKKKHGIFCVASPNFESNKTIELLEIEIDVDYLENLISKSVEFWEKAVFPVIMNNFT